MDPTSVNKQQVHLNIRRPAEFPIEAKLAFDPSYRDRVNHHKKATTSPKRLEDSQDAAKTSGNGNKIGKVRTKGKFGTEQSMQQAIKHSAQF